MVTGTTLNGNRTPAGWASYFLDHSAVLPGRPTEPLACRPPTAPTNASCSSRPAGSRTTSGRGRTRWSTTCCTRWAPGRLRAADVPLVHAQPLHDRAEAPRATTSRGAGPTAGSCWNTPRPASPSSTVRSSGGSGSPTCRSGSATTSRTSAGGAGRSSRGVPAGRAAGRGRRGGGLGRPVVRAAHAGARESVRERPASEPAPTATAAGQKTTMFDGGEKPARLPGGLVPDAAPELVLARWPGVNWACAVVTPFLRT